MKRKNTGNQQNVHARPAGTNEFTLSASNPNALLLLFVCLILSLTLAACAVPRTVAIRATAVVSTITPPEMVPPEIQAVKTPVATLPAKAPQPGAKAMEAVTLPEVVTPVDEFTPAAVLLPTAVFVPTATSDVPTLTPSPTPKPEPTATREPRRGAVRVVREALPNSIYCPMREKHVRDEARVIGRSAVCNLPIVSYRLGEGDISLILVGGIHGGYEWNTVVLAENTLNYLRENPEVVPAALSVYIVPSANPDGFYRVMGRDAAFEPPEDFWQTVHGRFNGNEVDLNRNWDCEWQAGGLWGNEPVSGGLAPFSEPESQALRDFFLELEPAAVLFWHSAADGVYAAGCGETDPASLQIAQIYGEAAEYDVFDSFDNYKVTGEAGDWLTTQGIPAITVELTTHSALDWEENLAGLETLMANLAAETKLPD